MKKRTIAFLLAMLMAMTFTACGSTPPETNVPETDNTGSSILDVTIPEIIEDSTPTPVVLESSGTLGAYAVEIGEYELCKDYDGNPAMLVNFTFTNNSEENASAMVALSYNAYQNGLQLDSPFIMDDSIYNANDLMKEIQPGTTISVKAAFALTSETAPVEFEVSETFSFDDAKLGKTFEISEGGVTELSVAPGADTAQSLGDYSVSIVSYALAEDYEGKNAIIVTFGFSNNSDETTSFLTNIDASAFQDGIELETAIIGDDSLIDSGSQMRNVRPGAGHAVTIAYLLTSDTSPVQLEIEEYFSFSSEKIETEINIAE